MKKTIDAVLSNIGCLIGLVHIYQGIAPKIFGFSFDVMQTIYLFGFGESSARAVSILIGILQVLFGLAMLHDGKSVVMHYLNIAITLIAASLTLITIPSRLIDLYNPVAMYLCLIGMSIISVSLIKQKKTLI